jgi:hypothetical protein
MPRLPGGKGRQLFSTGLFVPIVGGQVEWFGALAETEDPDVAVFNGTADWQGTLAATEAADTVLVNGDVAAAGISGTLASTEDVDAFTSPGSITGIFFDSNRKSSRITLSNSNLTATRAS